MYCRCLRRYKRRKNPFSSELGSNIYTKRTNLGLSLSDIEIQTGISRRLLADAEKGQPESLTVIMLQKLAYSLKCQPQDLLEGVKSLDISQTKSFVACDQCVLPIAGAQLRTLLQHIEQVHNLSMYDISHYLAIKRSSLQPYTYRQILPVVLQNRISNWLNRDHSRSVQAPFACDDCNIPRSGVDLIKLLHHLQQSHFVTDQWLADQLEIKLTSLRQYRHHKELPMSVVTKMLHMKNAAKESN